MDSAPVVKDKRGTVIEIGDEVAMATHSYRRTHLNIGIVSKITPKGGVTIGTEKWQKHTCLYSERIVVIKKAQNDASEEHY